MGEKAKETVVAIKNINLNLIAVNYDLTERIKALEKENTLLSLFGARNGR